MHGLCMGFPELLVDPSQRSEIKLPRGVRGCSPLLAGLGLVTGEYQRSRVLRVPQGLPRVPTALLWRHPRFVAVIGRWVMGPIVSTAG